MGLMLMFIDKCYICVVVGGPQIHWLLNDMPMQALA